MEFHLKISAIPHFTEDNELIRYSLVITYIIPYQPSVEKEI